MTQPFFLFCFLLQLDLTLVLTGHNLCNWKFVFIYCGEGFQVRRVPLC